MSNSPLVTYTKLSPNHSGKRTHAIDRITPHCVVGHCTVKTLGDIFAAKSRQASSNYGVDDWGGVGLYVDEANRSWCTSSNANDQRAITIEVASDTTPPYAFTDSAYETLTKLVVDICKRNRKTKLLWFGDKDKTLTYKPAANEMVLTVHRWFANKSCPGDWMYARMGDFAKEVNKRLEPPTTGLKVGDEVSFAGGLHYSSSQANKGSKVSAGTAKITKLAAGAKHPYHIISTDKKKSSVYGWVDAANVSKIVVTPPPVPAAPQPYLVKVTADALNIRSGPGTQHAVTGVIRDKGTYTIVDTQGTWGKLKSGAGWISLDFVEGAKPVIDTKIKLNDVVNFKGGKYYVSSTGGKYYTGKPGKAKVTLIVKGAKYPYHVIRTSNNTSVYGWVAADLVSK